MKTIDAAFSEMDRINFVHETLKSEAYIDAPLPIGYGQTISQPSTVKRILEWLEVRPGDNVLDIGSGSGWTTALLSSLVGPLGKVSAVEIIPELLKFGKANCERLNIRNTEFFLGERGAYGLPNSGQFKRILVSAAAKKLPTKLLDQLAIGGKMIIPVNNDILEIFKVSSDKIKTTVHSGFVFVSLI